jgi:hypothetical protein
MEKPLIGNTNMGLFCDIANYFCCNPVFYLRKEENADVKFLTNRFIVGCPTGICFTFEKKLLYL